MSNFIKLHLVNGTIIKKTINCIWQSFQQVKKSLQYQRKWNNILRSGIRWLKNILPFPGWGHNGFSHLIWILNFKKRLLNDFKFGKLLQQPLEMFCIKGTEPPQQRIEDPEVTMSLYRNRLQRRFGCANYKTEQQRVEKSNSAQTGTFSMEVVCCW